MGSSFSSNRRRNNPYPQQPPPNYPSSSSYYYPSEPRPPPPPPPPPPPLHNCLPFPSRPHHPYPAYPPPPPPPLPAPADSYYYSGGYGSSSYANPMTARFNYHPYHANQANGWPSARPPVGPAVDPPRYVEHKNAKKVRNDVNVHKDTLRVEVDKHNPDHHLVSFVFDALYDGR